MAALIGTTTTERLRNSFAVDGWVCYDGIDPIPDDLGNIWILQSLDGWHGGLGIRASPTDRPTTDGSFDAAPYFAARTVTLSGTLVAKNDGTLLRGMDRVSGVLAAQNRRGALVVDEQGQGLTRQIAVRLGGPTLVKRTGRRTAEFSLVLYASDPLRYGTVEHSKTVVPNQPGVGRVYSLSNSRVYGALATDAVIDAFNAGNATSWPRFTFNGPCINPTLYDRYSDEQTRLLMTLLAGQQVIVDTADRTVTYLDASRRHFLSSTSKWMSVESGWNSFLFDTDDKKGTCSFYWRDAWS